MFTNISELLDHKEEIWKQQYKEDSRIKRFF
jgi:hypothetical protein